MLLFLGALFTSTLLVLFCGFVTVRAERSQKAERREGPGQGRAHSSSFFVASGHGASTSPAEPSRNGVEAALHDYIRRERRVVAEFVSRPSLESLYRTPERPIATKDLTRHLERELRFAAEFVAEPSVENLYRRSERPAWIS
jgi:hypothetical protein